MELNRNRIVRELDNFHQRILNSKLAERITEREIMAIVNAATLLIEDEENIKALAEELASQQIAYNEIYELLVGERSKK